MSDFSTLGLSETVMQGVNDAGYTTPTQIQAESIPIILAGKDLVGASQTGTGKTAAFMLPTLSRLGESGKLRCLILEPTRELASQVKSATEDLGKNTNLKTLLVHGGVSYGPQKDGLEAGVDIVVATPGRLLDHMQQKTIDLSNIDVLILDEVDRMLDMGFLPDVRRIVKALPENRQTLFFSATMPPQIEGLASWVLKDPEAVEIGARRSAAETVSHYFYPVTDSQRYELLMALLKKTDFHSVMVFTRTKAQADRLFADLQKAGDYKCTIMHGDIRQGDRVKALEGFRDGKFDVIIATDLAARGLDISNVSHVINYQVPENADDYVHRIGRTGRAQKEGDAYTLLSGAELEHAKNIEDFIGQKVPRKKCEGFDYKYTALLDDTDPGARIAGMVRKRKTGIKRRRR